MAEKLTELQAQIYLADQRVRRSMLDQLGYKRKIREELEQGPNPIREQELREALAIVNDNLQRYRTEGLL